LTLTPMAGVIGLAIIALVLAITATTAGAASTRAEYVAQVDQTCTTSAPQFKVVGRKLGFLGHRDIAEKEVEGLVDHS
jgi:hypothetical protein